MVGLAWRYAVLLLGLIGTGLAVLTVVAIVADWPRFLDLDWPTQLLLVIAIASGGAQWLLFQRRRFQNAVILFFVTTAAWTGAVLWHLETSDIDCFNNRCTLEIKLAGQP